MRVYELIRSKRDAIRLIAERHGARNVRIFGSVVRGEAGPESDVNLLVEAGPRTSGVQSPAFATCWCTTTSALISSRSGPSFNKMFHRSELLSKTRRKARFEQARQRVMPFAEAAGYLTDEDVFYRVS